MRLPRECCQMQQVIETHLPKRIYRTSLSHS